MPYRRQDTDAMTDDWIAGAARIRRRFAALAFTAPVRDRNLADATWLDAELVRRHPNSAAQSAEAGQSIAPRNSAAHRSSASRPSSSADPSAAARPRLDSVSSRS